MDNTQWDNFPGRVWTFIHLAIQNLRSGRAELGLVAQYVNIGDHHFVFGLLSETNLFRRVGIEFVFGRFPARNEYG